MSDNFSWLCQPFAHRGLHDYSSHIIENSGAAILLAIQKKYAIEIDLQASLDHEPMVFHDLSLERLTNLGGKLREKHSKELKEITYKNSSDKILSLSDILLLVNRQVPILIEIKKSDCNEILFCQNIAENLRNYKGLYAVMSFHPNLIYNCLEVFPDMPRGLIFSNYKRNRYAWPRFLMLWSSWQRLIAPQFIAYDVKDIAGITPYIIKHVLGLKLLTWTVRNQTQLKSLQSWVDAPIFEGFEVRQANS